MEELEGLVRTMPWLLGALVAVMALAALRRPLKWAGKVLLRSCVSLGILAALGKAGGILGLGLGVNLFNALVMGVLGLPGFGLLLLMNWALAL